MSDFDNEKRYVGRCKAGHRSKVFDEEAPCDDSDVFLT